MRLRRTGHAISAVAMALTFGALPVVSAKAAAGPNSEEWWFKAFQIQEKVWPITKGSGVTVAVIDTGVNASLPDLSGVVLPGTALQGGGDGRTDRDPDPESKGHGTSMAITIAGQGGSNDWLGIAPDVRILPIDSTAGDSIAQGIKYAVDHGAKVINISQTQPTSICPEDVQQAVGYAADHDVVVVAAAGNTGDQANIPQNPADCAGVLAVGAVGADLQPWSGTQRQSYVAVSAPGYRVGLIGRDGVLYHNSWGTSIASAFTSGEAALIRAKFPSMKARDVVARIIATVKPVGTPGQQDPATGYGVIRIYRALTDQVPGNAPNPVYDALDKWRAGHNVAPPAGSASASEPRHPNAAPSRILGVKTGVFYLGVGILGILAVFAVVVGIILLVAVRRRPRPGDVPQYAPPMAHQPGGPPQNFDSEAPGQPWGRPPSGPRG